MRKTAIIFLILFALSILANHSYCEENKESQEKPTVDYMQKYYEKMAKEQEEKEKKVKEFEPTTGLGKFMGRFISTILIISLIGIFAGWVSVSMFGADEGLWVILLKGYTAFTVYLLINYAIWFILKIVKTKYINIISITSMIITAVLFLSSIYLIYQHGRDMRRASQLPQWICPDCKVTNHYNDVCWNCNRVKPNWVRSNTSIA